jgi:hypothetical protein
MKRITIFRGQPLHGIPEEIKKISDFWTKRSNEVGDEGSCVLLAHITFVYKGVLYELYPRSHWQGSLSWERPLKEVQQKLEEIGATNFFYNPGYID